MKNKKRILAVLMAAALATTSMTAFAAPTTTDSAMQTVSGSSTIENDNSEIPDCFDIVLPTITSDTYDFTVDRDQLLEKFDDKNAYDKDSYVYFGTTSTPASVKMNSSSNKFYEVGYAEVATGSFKNSVVVASGGVYSEDSMKKGFSDLKKANAKYTLGYYVWSPDTTDAGKISGNGTWVEITENNLIDLFDVEYTSVGQVDNTKTTLKSKNNKSQENGTLLFDGKIYEKKYLEQTDQKKLAKYITYDETKKGVAAYTGIKSGLYYAIGSVTPTAVTLASAEAFFATSSALATYSKAETKKINVSDEAKIENKSTYPVAITAKVKLVSAEGLTVTTSAVADSTYAPSAASIRIGVSTSSGGAFETSNVQYVTESATNVYETNLSYVLQSKYDKNVDGAVNISLATTAALELNKYQANTRVASTGSHNYYNYKTADVFTSTNPSIAFAIKAEINSATDASIEAWQDYAKELETSTKVKPTLDIVYNFDFVEQQKENKSLYKVSGGAMYLVSGGAVTGVATSSGMKVASSAAVSASEDAVAATIIFNSSKATFFVAADGSGAALPSGTPSDVKINGESCESGYDSSHNWITITGAQAKAALGDSFSGAAAYTVTFTLNGTNYTATYTK